MTDGYGPELVTNGSFDSDVSGWTATGVIERTRLGRLRLYGASLTPDRYIHQTLTTVSGKTYLVTVDLREESGGSSRGLVRVGTSGANSTDLLSSSYFGEGSQTFTFIATGTSSTLTLFWDDSGTSDYSEWDNVSVREMPAIKWGPHNLLTYSEDPSSSLTSTNDASWTTNNTLTATAQSGNQTPYARVLQTFTQKGTYVFAVETTSTTVQYLTLQTQIFDANANGVSVFDIQSGSVNTEASQHTATITATSEGFLCAIEFELDGTDLNGYLTMGLSEVSGIHRIVDPDGTESVTVTRLRSYRSDLGGMVDNPDRGDSYVPTTSSDKYLPRVGHHVFNGDAWVNEGVLAESEQRVNLITYSEDFTDASWSKTRVPSGGLNFDGVGPDGQEDSAVKLIDDSGTGTGQVYIRDAVSVSASTAYTFSVFAKKDQLSWIKIGGQNFTTPSNGGVFFNLEDGTLGTEDSGYSGVIQSIGNGWYRCSVTFTTDATDTSGGVQIQLADSDNDVTVDLDGTSSVLIYGAQLEAGSTPSSYIPTSGQQEIREAESFTIPSANLPWPPEVLSGVEEVTSGTFDTAAALDDFGTSGTVTYDTATQSARLQPNSQLTQFLDGTDNVAGSYKISWNQTLVSGTRTRLLARNHPNTLYISTAYFSGSGEKSVVVTTTDGVMFRINSDNSEALIDNISVQKVEDIAVSIGMEGRMTYADTGAGGSTSGRQGEVVFYSQFIDASNYLEAFLSTASTATGEVQFVQEASGVRDTVADAPYSPDILVPYNIASRHGSTFINGAVDGVALTANTTPTVLPDLSSTDLNLAYDYMGTISEFRVWDKDLGDAGIVEATNPSLEPSLSLTFEGTGTNSFVVNNWAE
jgi:hypothetical protein